MTHLVQDKIDKINSVLDKQVPTNDTFMSGSLGLAYYFYYTYKSTQQKEYLKKTTALIEDVFERLNSGTPGLFGSSLSSGATGLGFVINSIRKEDFPEMEIQKELMGLDEYLFSTSISQIENDVIDYLHGALGTLLYLCSRKPSAKITNQIDVLVEKICAKAVQEHEGCWLRNHFLQNSKDTVNFGLAHGLSGILLILINCYPLSNKKELIKKTVCNGIRFIQKHKMDINYSEDVYTMYPFTFKINDTDFSAPNRLAWCYGDLNQVLLFYRAGKLFEDQALIEYADIIGASTLLRKDEKSTMVWDSHFCHGAAGLAQIYKAIYHERNLPIYEQAYEYWIEQTILLVGVDLEKQTFTGKEHSLLEGLTGVGITLLSYMPNSDPQWSKVMLL